MLAVNYFIASIFIVLIILFMSSQGLALLTRNAMLQ